MILLAEVKWIKITTNMFEDEKIDFIESLPEADAILIIWIKLLTLAGKCNAGGFVFLTEKIPYTPEMLSHKFRRPLNTVKLALKTLAELEMIELEDEFLKITNWEKHQNIEGLERIREQNRLRKRRQREREKEQKALKEGKDNKCHVTSRDSHATDIDIDIDKDIYIVLYEHWNSKGIIRHRKLTDKMKRKIKTTLKDYDLDTLKEIIDNYAEIVLDEKYWFDYKWTLEEFLQRGLTKFEDGKVAKQNYLKDEYKNNSSESDPYAWMDIKE